MNIEELVTRDLSLKSTWKAIDAFLLECLRSGDHCAALPVIAYAHPKAHLAIRESQYIVLCAAVWAHLGETEKSLDAVRLAERHASRRFYYFDPGWGSYGFRFDEGQRQWVTPNGEGIHDNDPCNLYELHRYLMPLYENEEIQQFVSANFNGKVEPWGFDIASTPLCWLEEMTLGRKSDRCGISRRRIEKGEPVLAFRYFNGSDDIPTKPFVATPEAIGASPAAKKNLEKYRTDGYALTDFCFKVDYNHPFVNAFWNDLEKFSLLETLRLIAELAVPPIGFRFLPRHIDQWPTIDPLINEGTASELLDLLWVLVKCGYASQIFDALDSLPRHFALLPALFDRPELRLRAAKYLGCPGLPAVYETIAKSRLSAEDIAFLYRFGEEHPEILSLMGESLNLYEYHLYDNYACSPNWFFQDFHYFVQARGRRFLYLFASRPDLVPALGGMTPDRQLAATSGYGYGNASDAFYGAQLLHCEMKGLPARDAWRSLPVEDDNKTLLREQRLISKAVKLLK